VLLGPLPPTPARPGESLARQCLMAPKKKGKGEKKAGGGKDKPAGPTQEQAEELRLKISALEDKLLSMTEKHESLQVEYERSKGALEAQQADQADIVGYLKKEIEKRAAENSALEKKYVSTKEAKEEMENRLQQELTIEKSTVQELRSKLEESHDENSALSEQLVEYNYLKELSASNKVLIEKLQRELAEAKAQLDQALQQLRILAMPNKEDPADDGGGAIPLLLLEAVRTYKEKHMLVEQACHALQAVLSGDRKEDAVSLRKHGGLQLILSTMSDHPDKSGLQAAACGLLWKVAFTDPASRNIVAKENGIQLILLAMQAHLLVPRLQYNACGALRNLLVKNSQEFSVSSQIAGSRPDELPPLSGSGATAASPADASSRSPPNRRAVPRVGGVRAVVPGGGGVRQGVGPYRSDRSPPSGSYRSKMPGSRGMMSTSRSLPQLGGRTRTADEPRAASRGGHSRHENVSPSPPRRPAATPEVIPAPRDGVLEQALNLTLRSMSEHAEQSLVQEYGCGTLWNLMLANGVAMKMHACETDAVALVLKAMRAHPMATGVQLNASAVLKEFATFPKTLEQMKAGDARDALRGAIGNHPYNADLIKIAEETIHTMPSAASLMM